MHDRLRAYISGYIHVHNYTCTYMYIRTCAYICCIVRLYAIHCACTCTLSLALYACWCDVVWNWHLLQPHGKQKRRMTMTTVNNQPLLPVPVELHQKKARFQHSWTCFNTNWTKKHPCIVKVSGDHGKAFCTACKRSFMVFH